MKKYGLVVEYNDVVFVDEEIEAEDIDAATEIAVSEYNTGTIMTLNGNDIEFSDAGRLKIKIKGEKNGCVNIDFIKDDGRSMLPTRHSC